MQNEKIQTKWREGYVPGQERYDEDIRTEVTEFHGAFEFEGQRIVFGDIITVTTPAHTDL